MKRITIIVPDKIIYVYGKSTWSKTLEKEVERENIVEALELNDYHENLYFPRGSVKVESIEDEKNGSR